MTIFQTYTGNAMLNNALMTIEALAELEKVQDITPEVVKAQFQKLKFWELYKRMKSYTMLFTRNNLLTGNDKTGWQIYKALFEKILDNVEIQGVYQCQISGLRFETTFSEIYKLAQREVGRKEEEQDVNRCWFPLIGSLGSDAQALPQARFDISIHPICLVVIQFLPLSALLYKGSVLLFDTVNFDFARDFIAQNVKRVQEEIELTGSGKSIENIKDSDRGKYLLRSIELYFRKQNRYADRYTDINLWSFSNSGTGASCEVDRVPSRFFKKLVTFYAKTDCRVELIKILSGEYSGNFLRCLENGFDFSGLYPAKNFDGASVVFFEEYQRQIEKGGQLDFAKYIATMMLRATLSKTDAKLLPKTDAHDQKEYLAFFQKTLIEAAGRGEWSLEHHLNILDQPEGIPVWNSAKGIFKKVHFYFQKHGQWEITRLPDAKNAFTKTAAGRVLAFAIKLIEKDSAEHRTKHAETLSNVQKFEDWRIHPLLVRQSDSLDLSQASEVFYNQNRLVHFGLNHLLRVYFSQKEKPEVPKTELPLSISPNWLQRLEGFAEHYAAYYLEKYDGDLSKFRKHVLHNFPDKSGDFMRWLTDSRERMRDFYTENGTPSAEIDQLADTICQDDDGNANPAFARFALEFCLNRNFRLQHISSL